VRGDASSDFEEVRGKVSYGFEEVRGDISSHFEEASPQTLRIDLEKYSIEQSNSILFLRGPP